jgi:homoserine O-acetyltransferase
MEKNIQLVKGTYILLPITDLTSGHGTHSNLIWKYLEELLIKSEGN